MIIDNNSLSAALGKTHNAIINNLQVEQDKIVANRLENFFNRVIYNKTFINSTSDIGQILDQYLNEELAVRIRRSLKITGTPKFTWKTFEENIGIISQKILNSAFDKKARLKIKNNKIAAVAGSDLAYVPILDTIPEEYKEAFFEEFNNHLIEEDNGQIRTYKRMGKNDVLVHAELSKSVAQELELLNNLSFSIKNYSGTLKLEAVNPLKSYIAIMQHYKNYLPQGEDNLNILYLDYYQNKTKEADENVTLHLNHIMNIYALTGIGNFDAKTGKVSSGTRFLVTNTGRNIRVYSTAEIIKDVLKDGGTTYIFGSKKQRKNRRDMITLKIKR